jgi:hypothetical protein
MPHSNTSSEPAQMFSSEMIPSLCLWLTLLFVTGTSHSTCTHNAPFCSLPTVHFAARKDKNTPKLQKVTVKDRSSPTRSLDMHVPSVSTSAVQGVLGDDASVGIRMEVDPKSDVS